MPAGKPSMIHDWDQGDGLLSIESWARDGLANYQIAANIGISENTFTKWHRKSPVIKEALKKGRRPLDFEVENALLKRAMGYTVKVKEPVKVRIEKQKAGEGKIVEERIEMTERELYVPPDTTAQIFWLKNRKTQYWRDRKDMAAVVDVDQSTIESIEEQVKKANADRKRSP